MPIGASGSTVQEVRVVNESWDSNQKSLLIVQPLDIPDFLLYNEEIGIVDATDNENINKDNKLVNINKQDDTDNKELSLFDKLFPDNLNKNDK